MEPPSRLDRIPDSLWWAAPVALALGLRLLICFAAGLPSQSIDTDLYGWQARTILLGEPASYAPNGYPLFLALLLSTVPATAIVPVILILNVTWGTATVGLTYGITRTLARPPVAALAALIVAAYPNQLNYTRFLLTEVPSTFLLMLSLYGVVRFGRQLEGLQGVGAGLAMGLAILFRSALIPVAVGVVAVLGATRAVLSRGLPFGLGAGVILGAHGIAVATGHLAAPSNLQTNLLIAAADHPEEVIRAPAARFSEAEKARALPAYLRYVRERPGAFAADRLRTTWELWSPWPPAPPEAPRAPWRTALLGLRFPLLVVGLAGLILHRRERTAWMLALPALGGTALFAFFFADPRFTFIAEPGLASLGSLALAAGVQRWRTRTER